MDLQSVDLTNAARGGKLDPVPGRDTEMNNHAYGLHLQGKRCFESGFYAEAERCYRWALELDGSRYEHVVVLKLDLAGVWQVTGRFEDAANFYEEILETYKSGEYANLARNELNKLRVRQRQWAVPPDTRTLDADDQRFLGIVEPMLASYPALVRPVYITWVDESERSLRRIQEIQGNFGVLQEERLVSLIGWEALGVMVGYLHLLMVKSDWQKAKDPALRGLLAHELAHEELKDTFRGQLIDPDRSQIGFICNERATDLLTIAKGYGLELLESREFMERIRGSLDNSPALTTPKELVRLLGERY
ncbi:MAG: hypothetical protein OXI54_07720 [Chloroflexota bacterium]|nr:hypothetical protein [Chloroflexota bacterium]